jgi:Lon protease-like protein
MSAPQATPRCKAPLFPLPSVILVPGGRQLLHVFEPRYRQMVKDALAGEALIGVAVLDPTRPADPDGAPAVFELVGLGRIVEHTPLADGRAFILPQGVGRYRILGEDRSRAYRVATLAPAPSHCADPAAAIELAQRLLQRLRVLQPPPLDPDDATAACRIADQVLTQVPVEPTLRQQLFEVLDVGQRLRSLHGLLDRIERTPDCRRN